jgi:hypothetical protein
MSEPVAYFCPHGCGCLWRENRDGSMSLYGRNSKSCEKCERLPLNSLLPLYSFDTIAALLDERERLIAALEVVPGPITQQDLDWGVAVHYKNAMQEIKALKAERDALMSLIRDEIDENGRLRVLGGAAADENITAMIERVIAERGSFEALWRSTMDVLEAERAERDALARDAARLREGMLHFVEYGYNREVASALAAMKGASDE